MKVLIVGGVAGGASAAARLRRLDEDAQIIIFEKGEYVSFANCGLPYYIGGKITKKSALTLQTPLSFKKRFNVDVRIKNQVIKINPDNKTITVKDLESGKEYEESYDKLILSTGAEPIKLPIKGIDSKNVFTLRNIPDTYKIKGYIDEINPASAVIIGGGYIGIEMAENLKEKGLEVTVTEALSQIINPLDFEMSCEVKDYLTYKGVNIILNNGVREIKEKDNSLSVLLTDGTAIKTDMVISSAGVRPDSEIAEKAGIQVNARKSVIVDEYMETSIKDIYAVGDMVEITDFISGQKGFVPLAGPANKQGRIAADNIAGIKSKYKGTQGSSILKIFDMTVAATGINEKNAKAASIHYDKIYLYAPSHASYYPDAANILLKVLFEKETGRIIGSQAVGCDGVDKRIDVLSAVIRLGGTYKDLTELELCYAPPYSSAKDPINMAGYVIENIANNKVKNFHWHDIEELQKRDDITLLDVRTKKEREAGFIEGFQHIELDDLRKHMDKLDVNMPVYVHCHSGLRSYIACRILSQKGFDCYNLSGGYKLYSTVFNK